MKPWDPSSEKVYMSGWSETLLRSGSLRRKNTAFNRPISFMTMVSARASGAIFHLKNDPLVHNEHNYVASHPSS